MRLAIIDWIVENARARGARTAAKKVILKMRGERR
jgi:hypothetical protein